MPAIEWQILRLEQLEKIQTLSSISLLKILILSYQRVTSMVQYTAPLYA